MAGSLTKARQKLSRLQSSFVYAPNASHFLSAALNAQGCVRCGAKIGNKSLYAVLAQVVKHDISGGMICAKCVASFRRWMKEGE